MSDAHPFLDPTFPIRWSRLRTGCVVPDIEEALRRADQKIDAVAGTDRGRLTFESTVLAIDEATEELAEAWTKVGHLDSVANSDALREAHNAVLPKVSEFFSKLPLNEGLWDLLKTYAQTDGAAALTGVRKRYLDETLNDFRAAGADLPADKKARLEEIGSELARATQKFSENVLDSTNAWEMVIGDEAELAGLPATARSAALESAKEKGIATDPEPHWRFTLQMPSYLPLMEHLDDGPIRKRAWQGNCTVGRGEYDNTDLVWKILALRHEKAALLGKEHFADTVLERRMAKSGEAALRFVDDLHSRIRAAFNREVIELQEFKAEHLRSKSTVLEPWDTTYWSEKRRKALYDFDDEILRPYFPLEGVIGGMFTIAETIFELAIKERPTVAGPVPDGSDAVEVWHPEVQFYDVSNRLGTHLGSFYADWHPREPKRGGAWMNAFITGSPPSGDRDRRPHLGLICGNMTRPVGDTPALLAHYEVETIFHEFGHLLHHLMGEVEIKALNGINVAWDFVELPSQIMENFCWNRESLDLFARHYQTGKPIPRSLYRKMIAARNYMSAVTTMRQLAFAKLDLELHMHHAHDSGRDLDELTAEILDGYEMPLATRPPTIARRFSHLFASPTGYGAGYYSYKWAEVLDADAFTRFQNEGVLNPTVGREFKEKILSRGNADDPAALFKDFMGRDPDITALLIRTGLA
ncbi:M3 family metallopeptidase [soil metagenome]